MGGFLELTPGFVGSDGLNQHQRSPQSNFTATEETTCAETGSGDSIISVHEWTQHTQWSVAMPHSVKVVTGAMDLGGSQDLERSRKLNKPSCWLLFAWIHDFSASMEPASTMEGHNAKFGVACHWCHWVLGQPSIPGVWTQCEKSSILHCCSLQSSCKCSQFSWTSTASL